MELKSHIISYTPTPYDGSNRTFMELKFPCKQCRSALLYPILIVPLWN